jgi:hypothetical protein
MAWIAFTLALIHTIGAIVTITAKPGEQRQQREDVERQLDTAPPGVANAARTIGTAVAATIEIGTALCLLALWATTK